MTRNVGGAVIDNGIARIHFIFNRNVSHFVRKCDQQSGPNSSGDKCTSKVFSNVVGVVTNYVKNKENLMGWLVGNNKVFLLPYR